MTRLDYDELKNILLLMDDVSTDLNRLAVESSKDDELLEKIVTALDDSDFRVRRGAAKVLDRVVTRYEPDLFEPYVEKLFQKLSDKKKPVRNEVSIVLLKISRKKPELVADYAEQYLSFINSKNGYERHDAIEFLINVKDLRPDLVEQYLDKVEQLAKNDSNPLVRGIAEKALQLFKSKSK